MLTAGNACKLESVGATQVANWALSESASASFQEHAECQVRVTITVMIRQRHASTKDQEQRI